MKIIDVTLDDGSIAKGLIDPAAGSKVSPIVVDFLSPKLRHRVKSGVDSEAIVKAIGLKKSLRSGQFIYDFTAGLGTEAFLLAQAGYSVVAFERDPLIFELLEDGLRRFRESAPETHQDIQLDFIFGDAVGVMAEGLSEGSFPRAYAVTLDPMFEGDSIEGKSLPKKEMATLRRHLEPSTLDDVEQMFEAAFAAASDRVIVKRPNGADDLAGGRLGDRLVRPARRLEGKTARFDIYSCR